MLEEHPTIRAPAPHHAQRGIEKGAASLVFAKCAAPFAVTCRYLSGGRFQELI